MDTKFWIHRLSPLHQYISSKCFCSRGEVCRFFYGKKSTLSHINKQTDKCGPFHSISFEWSSFPQNMMYFFIFVVESEWKKCKFCTHTQNFLPCTLYISFGASIIYYLRTGSLAGCMQWNQHKFISFGFHWKKRNLQHPTALKQQISFENDDRESCEWFVEEFVSLE